MTTRKFHEYSKDRLSFHFYFFERINSDTLGQPDMIVFIYLLIVILHCDNVKRVVLSFWV